MGQNYRIVMLPGDGVGAEVAGEAERLLSALSNKFDLSLSIESIPCGGQYYLAHERDWPEGSEQKCRAADLILLGAVGWPSPDGPGPVTMKNGQMAGWSAVIGNRTKLDLYANIRPVKLYPGVRHQISGERRLVWKPEHVDMVFVRENTEDLYVGAGGQLAPGGVTQVATDTRIITRRASERIIRLAFELAQKRSGAPRDKKSRVTCVVKNNVLEGCKFFTDVFQEVAQSFSGIETEVAIIDAFTQWLVTEPERYDVIVTTNMFGDIITDLASVLQGGMGMAVGCNVGDEHGMFEPIHGSAPPYAGKDWANPMAMLLAAGEGLRWLAGKKGDAALQRAGDAVEDAVVRVLAAGKVLTQDLLGPEGSGTRAVTDEILRTIEA